jgi:hypothetical protein
MDVAAKALENALAFDVKKDGLTQRQNGDWVMRLTVAQLDMHQVIVNAKMGAIFQCVLVEKNDDETPVDHKAKERDKWKDLGPTTQAAMRCTQPVFWAWLKEVKGYSVQDEETAAGAVREMCGVTSRADLTKNHQSRVLWHYLDNEYQAWKAAEHG